MKKNTDTDSNAADKKYKDAAVNTITILLRKIQVAENPSQEVTNLSNPLY